MIGNDVRMEQQPGSDGEYCEPNSRLNIHLDFDHPCATYTTSHQIASHAPRCCVAFKAIVI